LKLLIIYQIDEKGRKFGGVETCIRSYISNAPQDWDIEIIGITQKNSGLKVGQWHDVVFEDRPIKFFPLLVVRDPNQRPIIPLVLRVAFFLFRYSRRIDFKDRLLNFHRIEPSFSLRHIKCKKDLFVHGNIHDIHNQYTESKWKGLHRFYFFIEPFFIKQFRKIFVVSKIGCEDYKRRYPEIAHRFSFLPTWYEPNIFRRFNSGQRSVLFEKFGISRKGPILIFVGRLEMQKDPLLLLEALTLIKQKIDNISLLLVGTGQLRSKIEDYLKEHNLASNVFLMGQKKPSEIAELLNLSDLFVLTSAFEGMPRAVLEALACGLPVVATDAGESSLVVIDHVTGFIVPERKPEKIAEKVIEALGAKFSPAKCQENVSPYAKEIILARLYKDLLNSMHS